MRMWKWMDPKGGMGIHFSILMAEVLPLWCCNNINVHHRHSGHMWTHCPLLMKASVPSGQVQNACICNQVGGFNMCQTYWSMVHNHRTCQVVHAYDKQKRRRTVWNHQQWPAYPARIPTTYSISCWLGRTFAILKHCGEVKSIVRSTNSTLRHSWILKWSVPKDMDVDGCWWMLVDVDGCWWMLMDVDGCWWMLMDVQPNKNKWFQPS